jgi:hypothetical protein
LFFFSTNESKGQTGYWDCNPCGYGPWKYVRFERVSNCTQPNPVPGAQANSCTISISFMYRKSECQPTNQLQFKMDIIRFTNGCYAQPRCFDIDLLSEAVYWTVDYLYKKASPSSGTFHDPDLAGFISASDLCLRNVESFSTGCYETIKRTLPVSFDGVDYLYEMRPCTGEACCRVGYVMCPVNWHHQNRDLYRRNAITGFENDCSLTTSPFSPIVISPSQIQQSSGCIPSCESYTVFPEILD